MLVPTFMSPLGPYPGQLTGLMKPSQEEFSDYNQLNIHNKLQSISTFESMLSPPSNPSKKNNVSEK